MAPRLNENGKMNIWEAYDGAIETSVRVERLYANSNDFWELAGKVNLENDDLYTDKFRQYEPDELEEPEKIEGFVRGTAFDVGGELISRVIDSHQEEAKEYIHDSLEMMRQGAAGLRAYKPDVSDPAQVQRIKHGAERMASWAENYADAMEDTSGSYLRGLQENPVFSMMTSKAGSIPNIKTGNKSSDRAALRKIDDVVRVLDQTDKPEGERVPILDDYMNVMDGVSSTIKNEYMRQRFSDEGWDPDKEFTYKQELKASNQRIVDSFDRIMNVEDKGQYDSAINNRLSELTSASRNMAPQAGYMKGEIEAIDKGVPADELFADGFAGSVEYTLKAKLHNNERNLKDPGNQDIGKLNSERKKFSEQYGGFLKLRDEMKKDKYEGPQSTLDSWHRMRDYCEKNPEIADSVFISSRDKAFAGKLNALSDRTDEMKDLTGAMSEFNTKRTDGWFSKESKEHKALRESAESLQRDLRAIKSGVYQEGPDKGKIMSEVDREILINGMDKKIDAMESAADTYLGARKKGRGTDAGDMRRSGAEKLKDSANKLRKSMRKEKSAIEKNHESYDKSFGVDQDLNKEVSEALDPGMEYSPENKNDFLKKAIDKDYKKLQDMSGNGFHDSKESFEDVTARVIAGKALSIQVNKGETTSSAAAGKIDRMAHYIKQRPGFKAMMQGVEGDVSKQRELAALEPGELYAKMATKEQNLKIQQGAKEKSAANINRAKTQQDAERVKQQPKPGLGRQ